MAKKVAAKRSLRKVEQGASDVPSYFLSLTIENVRCFGPIQTLDLSDGKGRPAQWTIILGDNGVGKTTILQSLSNLVPVKIPQLSNYMLSLPKESPLRTIPPEKVHEVLYPR